MTHSRARIQPLSSSFDVTKTRSSGVPHCRSWPRSCSRRRRASFSSFIGLANLDGHWVVRSRRGMGESVSRRECELPKVDVVVVTHTFRILLAEAGALEVLVVNA